MGGYSTHHAQNQLGGVTWKGSQPGSKKGVWHGSVGGEQLHFASLVFPILLPFTIITVFYFIVDDDTNPIQSTSFTLILLPNPLRWGERGSLSEWLNGA